MLPVADTSSSIETYMGESYRLIKREIVSFGRGVTKVWVYTVLSGPYEGDGGGKCDTKAEARKWARNLIKAGASE